MALVNQIGEEIPDRWTYPQADDELSFEPYRIISIDRLTENGLPADVGRPTGVLLASETPPDLIAPLLRSIDLVVIPFPKFRDGRGFTTARVIRQRLGFMGDVRALGQLLPDQLPLLAQCGFTSIVTPAEHPPLQWRDKASPKLPDAAQLKPLLQRLVKREN